MAKNKVLHDPIAYTTRKMDKTFAAPRKERTTTGRFMPAGSDYGTGFNNPVGKDKARGLQEGPIPFGCVAFDPADAIR